MQLFKRQILTKIHPFIKRKEAIIIRGMRRVGKTSLLNLIKEELLEKIKIKEENIYFFDLEKLDLREDFNKDPENLLKYIHNHKQKNYVFIDEIQYLDNPSNFLKIIVDHFPNLKIFTTGSSSLDIKRKIQDSLIGRAVYFQLLPLNFSEFIQFKKEIFPVNPTDIQLKKLKQFLDEYLLYGGFPDIVLEKNEGLKKELLKNYINLYITKDIRNLAEIENISSFNNLAKILASQSGNILNKHEISNTLNLAQKTTERYLDILEHTFVLTRLSPFFKNIRSRITKMQKIYFYDLGIRNVLVDNFSAMSFRIDNGAIFENFIFLELINKLGKENLYFYRTTHGTEIDFITDSPKLAIEVKYKKFKEKKIFRSFDEFDGFKKLIVNLNLNLNTRSYDFIDWWLFLKKINA